jgi:hypothetical protein
MCGGFSLTVVRAGIIPLAFNVMIVAGQVVPFGGVMQPR